jgi:hypothetical protein
MPRNRTITFDLYRSGRGFSGIVRIPTMDSGKAIFAKTTPTPTSAAVPSARAAQQVTAGKAIRLAARISQNPAVRALLPPGANLALKALQSPIGKFAAGGSLKVLRKLF